MIGRTRLTTPPGEEPVAESDHDVATELYSGGFELPTEPRVPARNRRRLTLGAVVILLVIGGYVAWVVATQGQFQDPALSDLFPGEGSTSTEGGTATEPATQGPTPQG